MFPLLSRSIHFYIRALRHIRPALTESMAASLSASLVQSRLVYANSNMYGMSASNMHKLQSAQNSLTRVVLPSLRHLSASERLSYLHWLPVHFRIQFKIATLTGTYKTLATCQPSYLYNLLQAELFLIKKIRPAQTTSRPRGVEFGEGVDPSPTGGWLWGGGVPPPQKNFSILPLNAAILVHFEPDFYYSATLFLRKKQCFGPLGVKIF